MGGYPANPVMQGILNGYSLAHQMKGEQLQQQQYARSVQRDADTKSANDLQMQMALRDRGYKPSTPDQDAEALTGKGYINAPAPTGGGPGLQAQMSAAAPSPQPQQLIFRRLPSSGQQVDAASSDTAAPARTGCGLYATNWRQSDACPRSGKLAERHQEPHGEAWRPDLGGARKDDIDARSAKLRGAADLAYQLALYSGKKALDVGAKKQEGERRARHQRRHAHPGRQARSRHEAHAGRTSATGFLQAMKALGPKEDPVQLTHISYDDKGLRRHVHHKSAR